MTEDRYTTQPVERRVFRDEIREQLIEDILSGVLPPGSRIVETRLAQQFGVSQAPVREALRDLALFGFVVSSPFRGTQVRRITPEELLEIYPIRAALEGVAARAAATRIDAAGLTRLEDLIATMREAAAKNDHRAQASADADFHHTIIVAAGNRMLEHVWQTMRLSVTTCVTHSVTHRSLHEIAERHVPVLDALKAHDPARAEAEIRRHIEEPGEWIRTAAAKASNEKSSDANEAGA
jgi:DNA-binding GntR family transcriptional regulator